jgi:hypothetical protein
MGVYQYPLEAPVSLRRLIIVPALAATLACGPAKLTRREAERDIRQDYPVVVSVRVAESARAVKGSPEHARLMGLQEALSRTGWFAVSRSAEGDREQFQFKLKPQAPRTIRTSASGFELPAAEAEFVRVLPRLETTRDGLRVTYLIRLVHPTELFPVFLALHPGVRVGETKERHASYRLQGRSWVLMDTDESFKKAL